jgi:hypothetical protein
MNDLKTPVNYGRIKREIIEGRGEVNITFKTRYCYNIAPGRI